MANQVVAGVAPPPMPTPPIASSVEHDRIGSRQIDCGRGSESQRTTDALISGVNPRYAEDLYSCVVPVLPAAVHVQPAADADAADVPLPVRSPSMATARVRANSAGTAWSQGVLFQVISFPSRSVMVSIGVGGHHRPSEFKVAPTLASSSGLTGDTPRVNEAIFCAVTCAV